MYRYKVTFIDNDGVQREVTVEARNEFEAVQLAEAFSKFVISVVNLDL